MKSNDLSMALNIIYDIDENSISGIDVFYRMLNHPDAFVKSEVIERLSKFKDGKISSKIISKIDSSLVDLDSAVRAEAASFFALHPNKKYADHIRFLINDRDAAVRTCALIAYTKNFQADAEPVLQQVRRYYLNEIDGAVATYCLIVIGAEVKPKDIARYFRSRDKYARLFVFSHADILRGKFDKNFLVKEFSRAMERETLVAIKEYIEGHLKRIEEGR